MPKGNITDLTQAWGVIKNQSVTGEATPEEDANPAFHFARLMRQFDNLANKLSETPLSKRSGASKEEVRRLAICFTYFAWMCEKMGVDDLALSEAVEQLYNTLKKQPRKEEPINGQRTH